MGPYVMLALLVPVLAAVMAAWGFRGKEVVLGIDLGTTYSALAYSADGRTVEVILDGDGESTTPSVVAVLPGGVGFVVGRAAMLHAVEHPEECVIDGKRVIGRAAGDPVVAAEAERHGGRLVPDPTRHRGPLRTHVFALPLHEARFSNSEARSLARHACMDPDALYYSSVGGGDGGDGGGGAAGSSSSSSSEAPPLASLAARHGTSRFLLLTPQAVGCLIVSHLLKQAAAALPYVSVGNKAVACVPAEFDAVQRQASSLAFSRAGAKVLRLMHEPTAAAVAYGLQTSKDVHYVLVYDMGGGTLDVSVLFLAEGSFTVIGTAGDNTLGGEDFDDCLAHMLAREAGLPWAHGAAGDAGRKPVSSLCSPEALSLEAERVKIALSGADRAEWRCPAAEGAGAGAGGAAPAAVGGEVTREAFERECSALFARSIAPVESALENAAVRRGEVDEIVLVGGSSRLPGVRKALVDYFGGRKLKATVDPDLAVAMGASLSRA
jgi:molecular chaperone DnaK (HSP70)